MRRDISFALALLLGSVLGDCGFRVSEISGNSVIGSKGHRIAQAVLTNITRGLREAESDLHQAYPQALL